MKEGSTLFAAVAAAVTFLLVLTTWCVHARADEGRLSLGGPLPLSLRYDVGETLCYRLVRHTTLFGMNGSKSGEHKAVAYFTRTRLENDGRGRVSERFTWESFAFGQSMDPSSPAGLTYLKEAEGFSLVCSVHDEDMLLKFDFSSLPRTLEGFWFMVMAWDAVTFDGPVRAQEHFLFPDEAFIGESFEGTRGAYDFEFEYPPLVTDSKYTFSGENHSRLLGVGAVRDIPCAIVEFSYAENDIFMNFDIAPVKLNIRGFEHIWGKTYLSLENGSIVKGELVAPIAQVQDMYLPGDSEPQHIELLALQRLELDLLAREEFDSEVAGGSPGEGD